MAKGKDRNVQNSEEQGNGENNQNPQNPKGQIVLGVYMHCQGCADTIVKYLRGFEGVEQVETDIKSHKVTIKGKKAIPKDVVDRLRKKMNKHVMLIYPIVKEKKDEKKEEKKKEPKVVEVVLKVQLHCGGCATDIKYWIHKMDGVQSVETDAKKSIVMVKGTFEAVKLVDYLKKRAGKHAIIVKQTHNNRKEDDKKKSEEKKSNSEVYYHIPPPDFVYAPQILSDENPNGCSIM